MFKILKLNKKIKLFTNFGLGEEKNYFIENLSMLLASGMNILVALEGIEGELRSKKMKSVIFNLKEDIESGSSLWRALDKTRLFSVQVISLIKIGEQSGRLSENLEVINIQQKNERIFRSKIRSAMMYPILVLVLMVVIGSAIAWFILPRLTTVFSQLNMELPLITKILIATGDFLADYGAIVVPSIIFLLFIAIYLIFIYSKTKYIGQWILFRLPIVKKLIQEVELARFGYILGTLLQAGLPIIDSLEALQKATSFRDYNFFYKHLKVEIDVGISFQKSFKNFKNSRRLMPGPIQQMIVSGEQSGRLSDVLIEIGKIFEAKTDTTTKNLTIILEPIMLIIVWLGVVGVAMAVILPIYSLVGGLN